MHFTNIATQHGLMLQQFVALSSSNRTAPYMARNDLIVVIYKNRTNLTSGKRRSNDCWTSIGCCCDEMMMTTRIMTQIVAGSCGTRTIWNCRYCGTTRDCTSGTFSSFRFIGCNESKLRQKSRYKLK